MLRLFDHHFLCRLVLAQADEARVAQYSLVGEFGECDLCHQLRLYEVGALAVGARHVDRGLVDGERERVF